jgi:hypothetical protein
MLKRETIRAYSKFISAYLRDHFLARWVLANVVGWTVGLYAGSSALAVPGGQSVGLPLICVGGVFAGLCVGVAQWVVLNHAAPTSRRWILMTMLGGLLAIVPSSAAGIFAVFGLGFGAGMAGAAFGSVVGGMQWLLLRQRNGGAVGWIVANALGGMLCAPLAAMPLIPWLPVGLILGSALFGYITGRMWLRLQIGE